MRDYFLFFKSNFKPVYFGWLLTLFSSFGQTFLISLFVPSILREFEFSRAAFGAYYSSATLLASLFLLKVGHVIDHRPIRPFTIKTVLLLSGSCVLFSAAVNPAMIFLALIGMRLGGQSLMPHISSSVMSRYFDRDRGKALSLSSLGFSTGEIIFPLVLGALIAFSGWRVSVFSSGIFIGIILLPLLRKINIEALDMKNSDEPGTVPTEKIKLYIHMMKKKNFWVIGFPTFFLSLTLTGLFFYQYILAEQMEWSIRWYAACFAGFGIAKLVFVMYGGILIDKFTARRLFPFFVIPSFFGFLVLAFITQKLSPMVFLSLIGVTVGLSGVITSAVIAEVYGTQNIGKIRSLFSVLMVIGAAIGPVSYGLLLDFGHSFRFIALASSAALLVIAVTNTTLERKTPGPDAL